MEKSSIKKIAVIGAESTGKTWLCEALAKHYKTVWVPEFAREYFNDSDIYSYSLHDLEMIAEKQIQLELSLVKSASKFLFCDTTLITLKIWAELEFESTPKIIEEGILQSTYTHYLITDNTIPWEEDLLRLNKFGRDMLFDMNVNEVKKVNGAYSIIKGDKTVRLRNAIKIVDSL